jgi:hypothetical protein
MRALSVAQVLVQRKAAASEVAVLLSVACGGTFERDMHAEVAHCKRSPAVSSRAVRRLKRGVSSDAGTPLSCDVALPACQAGGRSSSPVSMRTSAGCGQLAVSCPEGPTPKGRGLKSS